MSTNILKKYIQKMEKLRIDRAHGAAPNKPLFLLAIIEMIEQGQITENKILPAPTLVEIFMKYWSKVTDRRPNIALPFFHLSKSEDFWHLHANPGYETALRVVTQIKTFSRLREIVAYASLDDDLFVLLTVSDDREVLRQTLIRTYLPDFKQVIEGLLAETEQISAYREELLQRVEHTFSIQKSIESTETEEPIRTAGFRQAIMGTYNYCFVTPKLMCRKIESTARSYSKIRRPHDIHRRAKYVSPIIFMLTQHYTCAVCQLYILTLDGESVTEAAHIIPFSESYNDDVRNGISLCQLHHWTFDKGLISLDRNYEVIVSELMLERGPTEWLLTTLRGKSILLPEHNEFYPAQEALAWHREEVLRK